MSAPDHVTFTIDPSGDRTFLLRGELDMATVDQVTAATSGLGGGDVTFDLSELTFIDSSGVRALLQVVAGLEHGSLILLAPTDAVRRVFDIVGLADASARVVITG